LPEHILVEEQDIRISVDVISKPSQSESSSHIRFDHSLLHHMENGPDEPCPRLIGLQRKPGMHPTLKVPEETHIKALENVTGVRRGSDHFHSVIRERLECVRSHMNATIVHEQDGFSVCELFIRSQLVNIWNENFRNILKEEHRIHVWLVSPSEDQVDAHSESFRFEPPLRSVVDL
jgi:hypothetical protein